MDATGSTRTPTGARAWTFALGACGGVMLLAAVASIGSPAGAAGALGAVIFKAGSAWPAVLYLLGAHGLGRLVSRVWRGAALAVPLQFGAGLALMLTASHLLGVAGLLNGRAGLPIGLGVCVVGAALACEQRTDSASGSGERRLPAPAHLSPQRFILIAAIQDERRKMKIGHSHATDVEFFQPDVVGRMAYRQGIVPYPV